MNKYVLFAGYGRGQAIALKTFNADFDGDQMAVHLPLSVEAQAEAHILMLSTHNIFSPANGSPVISASQDIVLGVYFITFCFDDASELDDAKLKAMLEERGEADRPWRFKDRHEAILAYESGKIDIHDLISVRMPEFNEVVTKERGLPKAMPDHRRVVTTVGRVLFADIVQPGMPFYNCALGKKGCSRVIDDVYRYCGRPATINLLDDMKSIGFKQSTIAGLSFGVADMRIPEEKKDLLDAAQKRVNRVEKNYDNGIITERERYNQLLDLWSHCNEELTKTLVETLKQDRRNPDGTEAPITEDVKSRYLNPVYMMADSGARGNITQMKQLAGMRGLMAKPSGEIIETPIRAN
ncbi:MAG: DNA-directed RNA polymerase subunit beta', partial [Cyanobacteria bacterium P01_A01_bin.116]